MGCYLKLENISKSFGSVRVLDNLELDINRGEFLTILGASGSGKTTILRIIAGLEEPDDGKVILEDKDITLLPPEKRHVNMVFQNYALFEHMTVEKNIGYSLKFLKISKEETKARVEEALKTVDLTGLEKRMPFMLSGGQRQRVALARAIINKPKMLLLDEPLGALDKNLRKKMQQELKEIQRQLGITFVYITHDYEEAQFLSNRIAILNEGKIIFTDTVENTLKTELDYVRKFLGN